MDKPLSDKEKRDAADKQGSAHPPQAATGAALPEKGIGAYGSEKNTYAPPDLSSENWDKSKLPWNASPEGRLVIRLFSRGIMGAAFFTAGGLLNRRLMHDPSEWGKYDVTKPFSQQNNPLKFIAKLIDTVVGKPIEVTVKAITGSEAAAKNAVRFRPTKFKDAEASIYYAAKALREEALVPLRSRIREGLTLTERQDIAKSIREIRAKPLPPIYRGRSLGNEVVAVTFDFFCASIGDAFGRDIAGWVDPHVKKKWLKNGHIDVPEAVKSMVKNTWRYVTYNGGEDWGVAIPYVYFMKGQRQLINKLSPGFMYDFDRNLNGGSFKIDERGHVIGNYNIEGIVDLQNRFVVYNMGTLAYRELYDYVGRRIEGKPAVLYGSPETDTSKQSLGEKAANVAKWLTRSVVKAGIYMTPAVPFFWITRTPQTKHRGIFIHVNSKGEAMTLNYENPKRRLDISQWKRKERRGEDAGPEIHRKYENVYANELPRPDPSNPNAEIKNSGTGLTPDTKVYLGRYQPDPRKGPNHQFEWVDRQWYRGREVNPISRDYPFKRYGQHFGLVDASLNGIGKVNYKWANSLNPLARKMDDLAVKYPRSGRFVKKLLSLKPDQPGKPPTETFDRFTHPFVYASLSYTPYMYAKAEFAKLWDDGKMDLATERMIDGAASLNWNEFKCGTSEVWRSILHKPLEDDAREAEAQHRIKLDTSLPASVNLGGNGNGNHKVKDKPPSNWRQRVVQGEKPEIGANNPKGHAEREEMREALKDMQPPTNSIN